MNRRELFIAASGAVLTTLPALAVKNQTNFQTGETDLSMTIEPWLNRLRASQSLAPLDVSFEAMREASALASQVVEKGLMSQDLDEDMSVAEASNLVVYQPLSLQNTLDALIKNEATIKEIQSENVQSFAAVRAQNNLRGAFVLSLKTETDETIIIDPTQSAL